MRFASLASVILLAIGGTAIGGTAAGEAPRVSIMSGAGLECPDASALRRALGAARVPVGPPTAGGWTLRVEKAGGALRMSLLDPTGSNVLERALEVSSSTCEDTSRAIAIVVERFFRDLVWTPDLPATDHAAVPPIPAPVATTATAAPAASQSSFFLPPAWLAVGVGAVLWTRSTTAAVLLDTRVRVVGPLCVGAGVLLPSFSADDRLDLGGSARVSGVPIVVHLAATGIRGRFGASLGLEGLLTFEQGQSQGIASPAKESRTVLAAGVGVGGSVALGAGFRIAADVAGYRSVLGRSFVIDGIVDPVFEPPAWQAIFGGRLEWTPRY